MNSGGGLGRRWEGPSLSLPSFWLAWAAADLVMTTPFPFFPLYVAPIRWFRDVGALSTSAVDSTVSKSIPDKERALELPDLAVLSGEIMMLATRRVSYV